MEEMLLSETITETTTTMTEMEMLEQINSNLVMIGTIENLILGVLCVFLVYGMYKAVVKFFSMFI